MNLIRIGILSVLLQLGLLAAVAAAQPERDTDRSPQTSSRQTGTIEVLQQDSGTIGISGTRYTVDQERTRVSLEERQLRLHHLDIGMVVAYSTDGSGTLLRIELLGPADMLRELDQH
ncbi:MAG: hypothetical protein ACQETO_10220 [Pseudomonadota bacterium]